MNETVRASWVRLHDENDIFKVILWIAASSPWSNHRLSSRIISNISHSFTDYILEIGDIDKLGIFSSINTSPRLDTCFWTKCNWCICDIFLRKNRIINNILSTFIGKRYCIAANCTKSYYWNKEISVERLYHWPKI